MVDGAQLGQRVSHREAHLEPHTGIARVQRRQPLAGVESVDRIHQIEDSVAQHTGVIARGNQVRVRNIGAGQCRKDFRFPQDHAVAPRTQVPRTSPQHVRSAGPGESQHDVLRSSGDVGNVLQRALAESLLGHPFRYGF